MIKGLIKNIHRNFYTPLVQMVRLIKKEISTPVSIPLQKRLSMYVAGFFSYSYILYNLKENNISDYVSDIEENIKARRVYNADTLYIDNKLIFPQLIRPFALVPEEHYILKKGRILNLTDNRLLDVEELMEHFKRQPRQVIVKGLMGAGGEGVYNVECRVMQFYWNHVAIAETECKSRLQALDNFVVSEFIHQHPYAAALYADTVNTIRIVTLIDPDTREPFIAAAAQRIGNNTSYPVDNCGQGGFTAKIDIQTGSLGPGVSTIVKERSLTWYAIHPDSNNPIAGVRIPEWEMIKTKTLAMAANLAFIPMLGWDLVLTENGLLVIEANEGPDHKLLQVHEGLLKDQRVKRFYMHYNII